jgi:UDP-glucose 4-epimerase
VIGVWLDRILEGKPLELWGDGSQVRDFIYVEDLVEGIAKSIHYQGEEQVFNLGNGKGTSLKEILELVRTVSEEEVKLESRSLRSIDVPENVLDSSKAEKELGWKAELPLKDGVERTYRWMKEERKKGSGSSV